MIVDMGDGVTDHGDGGRPIPATEPAETGVQDVPGWRRQRWEAASAEVSDLVFAAPELYERAMTLVRRAADALRAQCPDAASLLRAADRSEAEVADIAESAGVPTAGLRLDLIASVALAMRGREITEEQAARARLTRVSSARNEGRAWALVERSEDSGGTHLAPFRRIDVHVASGAALIASIEPDEMSGHDVYRLQWARLDPVSGRLGPEPDPVTPAGEYADRAAWEEALDRARRRFTQVH